MQLGILNNFITISYLTHGVCKSMCQFQIYVNVLVIDLKQRLSNIHRIWFYNLLSYAFHALIFLEVCFTAWGLANF